MNQRELDLLTLALQKPKVAAEWLYERENQLAEVQARLSKAMALIDEQAEDDGLWFRATTASEAYLQQSLRLLTDAIEGLSDE